MAVDAPAELDTAAVPLDAPDTARARWAGLADPRRIAIVLALLTVGGAALRLYYAWRYNDHQVAGPTRLTGDEPGYDYLGWQLARGRAFDYEAQPPLYPAFLAVCYLVFGHEYAPAMYAQAIVGALAIPLTYVVARRLVTRPAALIAAALVATHPSLTHHAERLYSEAVYVPVLLVAVWALIAAAQDPDRRVRWLVAGMAISVATLTRPTTGLLFLLVPLCLARTRRDRWRTLIPAGLGAVGLLVPWTIHNAVQYHEFLPVSTTTAILWQGSPDYYHLMEQRRPYLDIWTHELSAAANGGHDPTRIDGDRWFTRKAVRSIAREPDVYAWYSLKKAGYLWIGHPSADWGYAPLSVREMRTYAGWGFIGRVFYSRLVFPLLGLAAIVVLRRRGKLGDHRAILVVLGYFTVVSALTYAEARHSEPLVPLLAILIAGAIDARGTKQVLDPPAADTNDQTGPDAVAEVAPLVTGRRTPRLGTALRTALRSRRRTRQPRSMRTTAPRLSHSPVAKLVAIVVLSRMALLLVGYLWVANPDDPTVERAGFTATAVREQINTFDYGDPTWYRGIAEDGYERRAFTSTPHANWAFSPAFPAVWRAVMAVDGGEPIVAAILANTLMFGFAVGLVFRLLAPDIGDRAAFLTGLLMIAYPATHHASRPGAESLFLLVTVGALLAARHRHWSSAAVLGSVATLTRPHGILILVPLVLSLLRARRTGTGRARVVDWAGLVLIPVSLVSFWAYLRHLTGNFFAAVEIQEAWDLRVAFPYRSTLAFFTDPTIVDYFHLNLTPLSVAVIVAATWAAIAGFRKFPIPIPPCRLGRDQCARGRESQQHRSQSPLVVAGVPALRRRGGRPGQP